MKQRVIVVPPSDGWKEHTVYLVEVQHFKNNPKHKALLHVGFLNGEKTSDGKKTPGAYSEVWSHSYDNASAFEDNYSITVLQELCPLV